MKNILSAMLFFSIVSTGVAQAEIFDIAKFPDQEKYVLSFVYDGIDLKKPPLKPFNLRYSTAQASIEATYETKFVGEGAARHLESSVLTKTVSGLKTKYFFKYKPGTKMILSYYEKTISDAVGATYAAESCDLTKSQPAYPENVAHPFSVHNILRGYDFKTTAEKDFYIWFNPVMVFGMKVALKGEEKITVQAGTFDCYRFEMFPDLVDFSGPVVSKMVKPFVAKYQLWLDKKAPHKLIRYKGPFGQINIGSGPGETFELMKVIQ